MSFIIKNCSLILFILVFFKFPKAYCGDKLVKVLSINQFAQKLNLSRPELLAKKKHQIYELHKYLTPVDLIRFYDYHGESHEIVTEDQYILQIHRVVQKSDQQNNNKRRKVVFLQHGIFSTSMDWLIAGSEKSLAFLLADAGYDVWLGNARGNTYSKKHVNPKISDREYWDFSWHEMGLYDLPACIDYVLNATGSEKLTYVGHSQGTTEFFVLLSERPEYNKKISKMFALAPIAYSTHMYNPFLRFFSSSYVMKLIKAFVHTFNVYKFERRNILLNFIINTFCVRYTLFLPVCKNIFFLITGFDSAQLDKDLLPAIFAHNPVGSSVKQLIHYAQLIKTDKFQKYDYDRKNLLKYKIRNPPTYNLKNVEVPVSMHYSSNDWIVDVKDVARLAQDLPKASAHLIKYQAFNHMDFLFAKDAKELLYKEILRLL